MSFPTSPRATAFRERWAPVLGGAFALLLSVWFAWSLALIVITRIRYPQFSRVPLPLWHVVNVVVFAVIAVAALRRRYRVQPWLLGAGTLTALMSAMQVGANRWALVPVAMGALMAVAGGLWKTPD